MKQRKKTASFCLFGAATLLALIGILLLAGAVGGGYSESEALPYSGWKEGESGALTASLLADATENGGRFYLAVNADEESEIPFTLVRMTNKQLEAHSALYLVSSEEEETTEVLYGEVKRYGSSAKAVASSWIAGLLGDELELTESDFAAFFGSYYLDCTGPDFLTPCLLLCGAVVLASVGLGICTAGRRTPSSPKREKENAGDGEE